MPTITIAPMALPNSITMKVYDVIKSANINGSMLFIQTERHPSSKWLSENKLTYESMDCLYDTVYDFDELNDAIAEKLVCGKDVVYAVCGRGISAELLARIRRLADGNNTDVQILPASGYAEAAATVCGFDLSNGSICSANSLPDEINIYRPLCVEEIDTLIRAGEVKLSLCEFYPEDCDIIFAYTDEHGNYITREIKLYELDRQKEYFATTVCLVRAHSFMELERYGFHGVEEIMKLLRAPGGCPWDIKQTHRSLKSALIEEAYEVIDAIDCDDIYALNEELGDLLLQIVFHAQIETEKAGFTMRDVCTGLVKKLIYRHPHVFSSVDGINTPDDVLKEWDVLKKKEKKQQTQSDALRAVPHSFPALMRSCKIQKRAADVGFDWNNAFDAMCKITEELLEVEEAARDGNKEKVHEEVGDLLFSVVNVARLLSIDPELALKDATDKFMNRFCKMEELILKDGKKCEEMSIDEMDVYWDICKKKGLN